MTRSHRFLLLTGLFLCVAGRLMAHDRHPSPPRPPVPPAGHEPADFVNVLTELARPDPAVDEDAAGTLRLLEHKTRSAIHVRVSHLDEGATYDVNISRGDVTEPLGKITTAAADEDDPPKPPRCYFARLDGAQEVPPVETSARGFGIFLVTGTDKLTLHYVLGARGLSGPATAAHIHAGEKGVGGDVVYPLDHEALNGSVDITADDLANLAAEKYYVNIHTEANPKGEIRGQIRPCFIPRRHFDEDRAGTGRLRIDTKRGDKLPLGATKVADLIGATVSVANAEGKVVLAGTIPDFAKPEEGDDNNGDDGAPGAGGAADDIDSSFDRELFALAERHDATFVRGDSNMDNALDMADAITTLRVLYQGAPMPYCQDAADANDDGKVDISDPVATLHSLFLGAGLLPAPGVGGVAGFDATPDQLFCQGE
jgi:hypothetical protein